MWVSEWRAPGQWGSSLSYVRNLLQIWSEQKLVQVVAECDHIAIWSYVADVTAFQIYVDIFDCQLSRPICIADLVRWNRVNVHHFQFGLGKSSFRNLVHDENHPVFQKNRLSEHGVVDSNLVLVLEVEGTAPARIIHLQQVIIHQAEEINIYRGARDNGKWEREKESESTAQRDIET